MHERIREQGKKSYRHGLRVWLVLGGSLAFVGGPFLVWDLLLLTPPLFLHLDTATIAFRQFMQTYLGSWPFVAFLGLTFLLEYWYPTLRSQKLLSRGLWHDLLMSGVTLGYAFFVLPFFVLLVLAMLERFASFAKLVDLSMLPFWLHWTVAFLWQDFILWVVHYLRHKVPVLWQFHAFHHSQRELNVFSEFRMHPLDMVVSRLLIVVPLAMVQLPPVSLLFLFVVQKWYLMFLHSNTRIHFRTLGYVVATPLFHRVHHAQEVHHANANFGVYLSVWDWLFGTYQEPHGAAACITGVVAYPAEQDSAWYAMGAVYVRQLLYPFQNLLVSLRSPPEMELQTK